MPGTFSPPQRVSDTDIHHGTCVTHVPWCMSGSLTSGSLWSRWRGKRSRHSQRMHNPQEYVSGKRPKPSTLGMCAKHESCHYPDTVPLGVPVRDFKIKNIYPLSCMAACTSSNGCVGVTFDPRDGMCRLYGYSAPFELTQAPGVSLWLFEASGVPCVKVCWRMFRWHEVNTVKPADIWHTVFSNLLLINYIEVC